MASTRPATSCRNVDSNGKGEVEDRLASLKPKFRYCDKLGHTLVECMKRKSDMALAAPDANLREQAQA